MDVMDTQGKRQGEQGYLNSTIYVGDELIAADEWDLVVRPDSKPCTSAQSP